MNQENYHAAMNAPIQRNSDDSDNGIEMYPDSWQTIKQVVVCSLAIVGLVALCAAAGFASASFLLG